jgi:hypothetical protein
VLLVAQGCATVREEHGSAFISSPSADRRSSADTARRWWTRSCRWYDKVYDSGMSDALDTAERAALAEVSALLNHLGRGR